MDNPTFRNQTEADTHYLTLALAERAKSDDPKAEHYPQSGVAALLVSDHRVIERSANVLPPTLRAYHHKRGIVMVESDRYHLIEHAERAVIFKAWLSGKHLQGAMIYCTRFPCSDCARAIVWAGIKRAVVADGYEGELRWREAQKAAQRLLRQAGVTVRVLKMKEVLSSGSS